MKLFAKRTPGFLVADLDGHWRWRFRRRKNGEEVELIEPGVKGGVDQPYGQINGVPRFHGALLSFDPLLGSARKNVKNLLHVGVVMETVRFARLEMGTN